jgi:hypothetical protein
MIVGYRQELTPAKYVGTQIPPAVGWISVPTCDEFPRISKRAAAICTFRYSQRDAAVYDDAVKLDRRFAEAARMWDANKR